MNEFDLFAESANHEFLSTFGEIAIVNGMQIKAIFTDDQIDLDTGYKREPFITIERDIAETLSRGDLVDIRSGLYKISNVPDITSDTMIEVELKRA